MMRRWLLATVLLGALGGARAADDGWLQLFNGKDLEGWEASENKDCFKVEEGLLIAHGKRSHLFWKTDQPLVNFELRAEIMTTKGSNSGIFFHTKYQETGWPNQGFEIQVNNTHKDPIKTGSLYKVQNNLEAPAKDDEWFVLRIRVEGKRVQSWVNDKLLIDWTQPEDWKGTDRGQILGSGTIALQGHDPESLVKYRKVELKRLP